MSEILVLAEHSRGKIKDVTFEMLGIGRELADSIDANAVHGSDAAATAAEEIAFFFKADELVNA